MVMALGPLRKAFAGINQSFREDAAALLRLDSWINAVTGLGGSRDRTTQGTVKPVTPLAPATLEHLYHGNDLAAKLVDKVVRDGLRRGFEVEGDEEGELPDAADRWDVLPALTEAAIWGRLYGGGAVVLGLSDSTGKMDEPLDPERVGPGDLLYLMSLDRQSISIVDRYEDPLDPKFGRPMVYRITYPHSSTDGSTESGSLVHESRLVMFGGEMTSERMKRRNEGWDLSTLQRPNDILRDTDQSWRSVMNLVQDMSQAVFKIEGLIDMIAEGEKDTMLNRMEVVDMARSVARAVVIDAESEGFEHVGAVNVTGVEPLMMMIFQRLAGTADMPLTILLGMSPAGLNATGESDTRHWYDTVEAWRSENLEPALIKLLGIVARSEGITPPESGITIAWPSLWQPTSKEQAELDKLEAETDKIRVDSQVLFPEEIALVKFRDGDYADVLDVRSREEALQDPDDLPDPLEGLDPSAPVGGAFAPPGEDVAKTALNGAQVSSLLEVVTRAAEGQIPRDTAVGIIVTAFPISEAEAERVLGEIGRGFEPERNDPPPMVPGAPPADEGEDEDDA